MNKMIFAKRMIGMAIERKLIPGECFSKRGSNCISAVMTKILSAMNQEFTTTMPYLRVATLLIATIELRTTLLPFPFEHGASLNQRSTYYSKLWRGCGFFTDRIWRVEAILWWDSRTVTSRIGPR
jgi:hypothetical protein